MIQSKSIRTLFELSRANTKAFVQVQKENDVLKQNAQELWEKLQKYEERNVLGDKTNIKSSTPTKNEVIKV